MKKRLACVALTMLFLLPACRQPAGAETPQAASEMPAVVEHTEEALFKYKQ